MKSGSFTPGDLAVWHSGSAQMSWPPDGDWDPSTERLEGVTPKTNQIVLIVARLDYHGAIVLFGSRFWWCPIGALRGEPSGSWKVE